MKLNEFLAENPEAKAEFEKLILADKDAIEKAEKAGYQKGYKAGKNAAAAPKTEAGEEAPECFKKYPKKIDDVTPQCRACKFAQECKKESK